MSKTTAELKEYFSKVLEKEKLHAIYSITNENLPKLPAKYYNLDALNLIHAKKITASNNLLELYSENIICDEKYRDLIPVATILGYLSFGDCTTLEDAYAKYDKEAADGTIITEVDQYSAEENINILEAKQPYLLKAIIECDQALKEEEKKYKHSRKFPLLSKFLLKIKNKLN